MGRPPNPSVLNRVRSWSSNGYHYAYVYQYGDDEKEEKAKNTSGDNKEKPVRKKIYIGVLDENLVLHPNDRLRLMNSERRRKLIFPETWDLTIFSELDAVSHAKKTMPTNCGNDEGNHTDDGNAGGSNTESNKAALAPSTQSLSPEDRFPLYNSKVYGDFWFCEEVLKLKGARDDLLVTFDYDVGTVNDIITLAIYPLLSQRSYNMVASWQQYHHTPSSHLLDSSFISKLSRKICDGHRLEFSRLRVGRQPPGSYGCVDSTTRSGYTSPTHIVNVRFGHNKDGIELACTSDVVVYSLSTHEPVYYKAFPGNQSDMTTIRTILTELKLLGITDIILITDRGYCSQTNIGSFISEGIPFLTAAKVEQTPVFDSLSQVKYDEYGLPCNMSYDEYTGIYCLQVNLDSFDVPLPNGNTLEAKGVKVNLYLDIKRRIMELNKLKLATEVEMAEIAKINSGERSMPSAKDFNKEFKWFRAEIVKTLIIDSDGNRKAEETTQVVVHTKAREKAAAMAGFFSSIQWNIQNSAEQSLHDYRLRDEQEKYFYGLKDVLGSDMQDVWTEGTRIGRDFIYFVGLIVYSWVKFVWRTTSSLKKDYRSTELLIDAMAPIRYAEYPNGVIHMTSFNGKQINICIAFNITPPSECMTCTQKLEYQRVTAPRKRGRPKGSKNKPKM